MVVRNGIPAEEIPRPKSPHEHRWIPAMVHSAAWGHIAVVSVYGYSGEGTGHRNRALFGELQNWAASREGAPYVIGGDWNVDPEQLRTMSGDVLGVFCNPGVPTCRPSRGEPREIDYWLVSPAAAARVTEWGAVADMPIATHDAVRLELDDKMRPEVPVPRGPRPIPEPDPDVEAPEDPPPRPFPRAGGWGKAAGGLAGMVQGGRTLPLGLGWRAQRGLAPIRGERRAAGSDHAKGGSQGRPGWGPSGPAPESAPDPPEETPGTGPLPGSGRTCSRHGDGPTSQAYSSHFGQRDPGQVHGHGRMAHRQHPCTHAGSAPGSSSAGGRSPWAVPQGGAEAQRSPVE